MANEVALSSGSITYKGSTLHTTGSTLLGGIAYSPMGQGTDDWYYLTDDLNVNGGNGWPPSISYMSNDLFGAALTVTGPTTTTTSVNSGSIASSYLLDFYYRIHLSVYNINLGNVLSEQTYAISIWNAWFTPNTLTNITNNNLPDVVLNLGITLPKVFTALEYIDGTVSVAALGTPSIGGYFDFSFNTETPRLSLTGQRIIFWPFMPQSNFTEVREWVTDIIPTIETEQRFSLREIPRMSLNYNYSFQSQHEYSMAKSRARGVSTLAIATALWTDVVKLTNLSVGTTVLTFDTTSMELEDNQGVLVLWESYEVFEIVEILSHTSTSVTLKNPTLSEHLECWVSPVRIGYLQNGIEFSRGDNHKISSNLTLTTSFPYYEAIWPTSDTYLGLKVLPETTIASGGLSEKVTRPVETFDSITGEIIQFDTENYTRISQTIRLRAHTQQERFALRRQLDYLKGKYTLFWLPSFNTDLTAVTPLLGGNSSFKVRYANWSTFPEKYIKIIGSRTDYFEVIAVTNNFDGTESIEVSPIPSTDLTSIRSVQVITKVRLDADRIEYNHQGTTMTMVSIPVIEVA